MVFSRFFFFSSRRRHTRWNCDWSSDVCSSDLADVGVEASMKIASAVRTKLGNDNRPDAIRDALKSEIAAILTGADRAHADSGDAPLVIMLVGVNGAGKTTTLAKLAARLKSERGSVIVA